MAGIVFQPGQQQIAPYTMLIRGESLTQVLACQAGAGGVAFPVGQLAEPVSGGTAQVLVAMQQWLGGIERFLPLPLALEQVGEQLSGRLADLLIRGVANEVLEDAFGAVEQPQLEKVA
jgi:hypothetical protein